MQKNLIKKLAALMASYREEGAKPMRYQKGEYPMLNNTSNDYNAFLDLHWVKQRSTCDSVFENGVHY